MADLEHLAILQEALAKRDISIWDIWRTANLGIDIDLHGASLINAYLVGVNLSGVNLSGAYLRETNLRGANLSGAVLRDANLSGAVLRDANLRGADLSWAVLIMADLSRANLSGADLRDANLSDADLRWATLKKAKFGKAKLGGANLWKADLSGADLSGADLSGAVLSWAVLKKAVLSDANLRGATLLNTNFKQANLNGCKIYGISAWDVNLEDAKQENLIITDDDEAIITVDNLEVAQFIYLMLHNEKIRNVLETITTKSVLILGRFSDETLKATLDAMRNKLRELDYLPIVFDFERLTGRNFTETIQLLAGLSKFIVADLSQVRSIPQELQAIVPDLEIPVVPIIQKSDEPFSMHESHIGKNYVLKLVRYTNKDELINNFDEVVIKRAEEKYNEIVVKKSKHNIEILSVDDILNKKE